MRASQLFIVLDQEFKGAQTGHHTPVMIWGPPGVGKSQLVQQVAEKHERSLIDIRLSQMEPSDLRGIPFKDGDKVEWAVPSMLPDADKHGSEGILFLDEITSAPPSVSAAAYQLILDRRLGDYKIPDGWAIFAAGNRQGDRGVTYSMPAPLANRFSHYEIDIHLDDWVAWAYQNGIDEKIIAFLRFRPDLLFDFDPAHNPVAFPTPRTWEFVHNALQKFSDHPELFIGALQSCVGPAAGIELNAFIANLDQMPDLDAIINGETVPTPTEIDLQYAVASALVGRAIRARDTEEADKTYTNILKYAASFRQKEMGVMLVSDMHRAIGEDLFAVEEFANWADAIADIMLYGVARMDEAIENKLGAARTRLILDKPFLGALVLRLPIVAADQSWCKTTDTDMKKLYINPEYIAQLSIEETQFALAHEALHCALSHFSRRTHRVKLRWDMACDFAINPILIEDGLKPPPHILYLREYIGMTAEEIYPTLADNENDADNELGQDNNEGDQDQGEQSDQGEAKDTENKKLNSQQQNDGENGKGQTGDSEQSSPDFKQGGSDDFDNERQKEPPPTPNNDEIQTLSAQWQQRLAGAAQQALQAGKLSQSMARLVDHLLQPQLPWRMLLAHYMSATAREDYSYTRPSSRRGEPAIYPRLRSHMVNIVVALDISGSIATKEIKEFLSEVDQIKAQVRARIALHACDTDVTDEGPWEFEPWDELKLPIQFKGGGGTRFTPVFDWVEKQEMCPDLLVYFTDAEGEFPQSEPQYPVIWLVKGKAPVPWGQRIQLN